MSSLVWRLLAGQLSSGSSSAYLYTWGDNSYGNLGAGSLQTYYSWNQISVGESHTVGIKSDGTLWAWGGNLNGQLGDGTTLDKSSPIQIAARYSWSAVSAGSQHTLAIKADDGTLWAWGANNYGQVSMPDTTVVYSFPVLVNSSSWTQVSAGAYHSAAIDSNGGLYTWGSDTQGQLGNRGRVASMSVAGTYIVALKTDSTLWVTGYNAQGQLGLGDVTTRATGVYYQVPGSWTSVITGRFHALAIKTDGTLWAWGYNTSNQLGDGTANSRSSPIQISTNTNWLGLNAGNICSVAWDTSYNLYTWGYNGYGQLGLQDVVQRSSPSLVATYPIGISKVLVGADTSGYETMYVLLNDNTVYGWGNNISGQLGQGDTIHRSAPVQIPGRYFDIAIPGQAPINAAGGTCFLAIGIDNYIYACGYNASGQYGDNTTIYRSSPTQIGTYKWSRIFGASMGFYGIKNDTTGTLWGWGYNGYGELGQNDVYTRYSPVVVSTYPAVTSSVVTTYATQFFGSGYNVITYNANHNLAGFDFTIEAYIYPTTSSAIRGIINNWQTGGQFSFYLTAANVLKFDYTNAASGVSTISVTGIIVINANTWTHVAVARYGNFINLYVNGFLDVSYYAGLDILYYYNGAGKDLRIGISGDAANPFTGYISNLRIVKRTAVYTGGFVLSTSPLTNTTGTLLLTANSNTIADSSTYAWTMTSTGTSVPVAVSAPVQIFTKVSYSSTISSIVSSQQPGTYIIHTDGHVIQIGGLDTVYLGTQRSNPTQIASVNQSYQYYLNKVGSSSYSLVSAKKFHTAAITSDGKLFTWGSNAYGLLGDSSTITRSSPVQVGASSWAAVSAGGTHTVGIKVDNTLWAWGNDSVGQLGDNTIATDLHWENISDGGNHYIALRSDGSIFAWGYNGYGQLGDGTTINRSSPVQISSLSWLQVSGGSKHTVALRNDGTIWGWGNNFVGQLGQGDTTTQDWVVLNIARHVIGLRSDGTIWGWGYNAYGEIGTPIVGSKSSPVQIGSEYLWTDVVTTDYHSLAVRADGTLWAWGRNVEGQLGDGTTGYRSSPVQISTTFKAKNVFAASQNTTTYPTSAVIDVEGKLYTWGAGTNYILGDGTNIARSSLSMVQGSWSMVALPDSSATANLTGMGIKADSTLWGWGVNTYGSIGQNDTVLRSLPVQIGINSYTQVASTGYYMAAITTDYRMFVCGDNTYGNLGQNDTISRSSPVQVPGSWSQVRVASYTVLATRTDGTLWSWGINNVGQLGLGDIISRSSPVQIGTENTYSLAAIKLTENLSTITAVGAFKNNTLYMWGYNSTSGTYYNNWSTTNPNTSSPVQVKVGFINYSSPVQMGTGSSWSVVAAGASHTMGITINGALYGWGLNTTYQIANAPLVVPTSWTKVSIGPSLHVAAISNNNTVSTWGNNTYYQVDTTAAVKSSPVTVISSTYKDIAAGYGHVIGIRQDGTVWGWGGNTSLSVPGPYAGGYSWTQIISSSEASHTVAIRSDKTLWTWGFNSEGQLGDGTTVNKSSPVSVGTYLVWTSAAVGKASTYILRNDGYVYAFGRNAEGQLGDGTTVNKSSPVQIGTSSFATVTAAGYGASLISLNSLYSMGLNSAGQLGLGDTANRSSPTQVGTYFKVAMSASHTMALGTDGSLWTWGNNADGQLGDGLNVARSSRVQIGTNSWTTISASINNSYAIGTDNTLWAWGKNDVYQVGDISNVSRSSPVQVAGLWSAITAGNSYALGITSNGLLYGWGSNTYNQTVEPYTGISRMTGVNAGIVNNKIYLWGPNTYGNLGDNTTNPRSQPVQLGNDNWISISTEGSTVHRYTVGIKSDYTLWAWGDNTYGQLGDNTTVAKSSPVQIPGSWTFAMASRMTPTAADGWFTVGINTLGQMFTWGDNVSYTQLGTNDTIRRSSPTQIGTFASWTIVDATLDHCLAITNTGKLYAWGYNTEGQLGTNDVVSRSSPVQVLGSWSSVSAAKGFSAAITNDGRLFTWGRNNYGQLGSTSSTVLRSSPVQIATAQYIVSVAAHSAEALAYVDNTYKLFTTGAGISGLQGIATTVNRSSPVQVGALSWTQVWSSGYNFSATTFDNKLFSWGDNTNGAIGDNTTASRSSPVQVSVLNTIVSSPTQIGTGIGMGTSSWVAVSTALNSVYAITQNYNGYIWGLNSVGQLGDNSITNRAGATYASNSVNISSNQTSPIMLLSGSWSNVYANNFKGVALIRNDKTLWVWGINPNGELGDGTTITRSTPVQIAGSWNQIATGDGFMTGIKTDGSLWVWGNTATGLTGNRTQIFYRSSPVQVGTSSWSSVAAGASHILALSPDKKMYAWGLNTIGQLGVKQNYPVNWTQLAFGDTLSFGINTLGQLFAWGSGALGTNAGYGYIDNTTNYRSSPVQIAAGSSFTILATNVNIMSHMAVVGSDNNIYAWGYNGQGQLGDSTTLYRSSPVQITSLTGINFSKVMLSGFSSYALGLNGTLWVWGDNQYGQLGDNTTASRSAPVQIPGAWKDIVAVGSFAAGIKNDGSLWAWGNNTYGQLGTNDIVNRSSPTAVNTGAALNRSFTMVAAGSIGAQTYGTLYALATDGTIIVTGYNGLGEAGINSTVSRSSPTQIGSNFKSVYSSMQGGFGLTVDNKLFAWGNNAYGQLGTSDLINRSSPVQIMTGVSDITNIYTGYARVFANTASGTVYYWGYNATYGQLGDGTVVNKSNPQVVKFESLVLSPVLVNSSSYTMIAANNLNSGALKPDGTLWVWGNNSSGQLGQGYLESGGPFQYMPGYTFNNFALGPSHVVAFGPNYTYASGDNASGTLGVGDSVSRSSPTQIDSAQGNLVLYTSPTRVGQDSWSMLSLGLGHTLAMRSNYTLWAWGDNTYGQLGILDTALRSSPVQVPGSWIAFGAGDNNSGGILQDHTLYMWGLNTSGQVGDGTTVNKSSPTLIPGSWLDLRLAGSYAAALSYSNSLFVWGASPYGALNNNSILPRSSPMQIGAAFYKNLALTDNAMAAIDIYGNIWTSGDNKYGQLGNNNA